MRLLIIAGLLALLPWTATAAPTLAGYFFRARKAHRTGPHQPEARGPRSGPGRSSSKGTDRRQVRRRLPRHRSNHPLRLRYAATPIPSSAFSRRTKPTASSARKTSGAELPVRSGTLDDKVLREVCRPQGKPGGAGQEGQRGRQRLKAANDAVVKKENGQGRETGGDQGVRFTGQRMPSRRPFPSIRPNLKAAAGSAPCRQRKQQPRRQPRQNPLPRCCPAPAKRDRRCAYPASHCTQAEENQQVRRLHARTGAHSSPLFSTHISTGPMKAPGPENWSKLDPQNKACAIGERQSPIDIRMASRLT